MHLSMYCPTTPLGHIWGNGGGLTQSNIKCPMVGWIKCVKSPCDPLIFPRYMMVIWHRKPIVSMWFFVKLSIVGWGDIAVMEGQNFRVNFSSKAPLNGSGALIGALKHAQLSLAAVQLLLPIKPAPFQMSLLKNPPGAVVGQANQLLDPCWQHFYPAASKWTLSTMTSQHLKMADSRRTKYRRSRAGLKGRQSRQSATIFNVVSL